MKSVNCALISSLYYLYDQPEFTQDWDYELMGLLPDTQNCGLRMRRECRERFPRHRVSAISIYVTAHA